MNGLPTYIKFDTPKIMLLLMSSVGITLLFIFLGAIILGKMGRSITLPQLQIFIAIATGFMMILVFVDLIPHQLVALQVNPKTFFSFVLLGMGLVILAERYLTPRLTFLENIFHAHHHAQKIEVHHHQEGEECHHHLHEHHHEMIQGEDLKKADDCDGSHEHGHLHAHTHPELIGKGEVCSAIACFMVCSFFDGVSLASVQSAEPRIGFMLVFGVVMHLLPEGILSGMLTLAGGASLKSAQKVMLLMGGSFLLGAMIPISIQGYELYFMALSIGILMFVTLVQLLPTALRVKHAPAWLLAGFALFGLVHELVESITR